MSAQADLAAVAPVEPSSPQHRPAIAAAADESAKAPASAWPRRIVVDRHDGSLTLDSAPGRTTFRVRLPFPQS
jgi:hypothetical protein